jgi:hypothetical protein
MYGIEQTRINQAEYQVGSGLDLTLAMYTRRLDDRIRCLCVQVTEASNEELESLLQQLLSALHEKIDRLRGLAASQLVGGRPPKDRRALPP